MNPRVVVASTAAELERVAAELAAAGWHVGRGFDLPAEPVLLTESDVACVGIVSCGEDAEAALLATSRGASVAVAITLPDPIEGELLVARLQQLVGDGAVPEDRGWAALDPATSALLDHLAAGVSVAAAARRVAMSLRTANRRLADARSHYGVATNREAVVAHVRRSASG